MYTNETASFLPSTAVVTGGDRGIGAEIVRELSARGWQVAIGYHRRKEEAEQLASSLPRAQVFQADVSEEKQVQKMFFSVRESFGEIGLLVNNAGIAQQKLFTDLTQEDWDRMFDVDVKGMFFTCREVLPEMIRRHSGRIINLSSIWGITGASCEVHYSAAKAAVIGLTKALAKEVGPSGITVNCVAPGVIATEMNAALSEETLDSLREETPLCRIGSPRDIAHAVAFLASEQAGFLTGQVISPNGGLII